MTDGILLNEMQRDRTAAQVRHDHHRRGPRAVPQHRLHPRLPQAAAAAPTRPQGHHHLGDDRPPAFAEHFAGPDGSRPRSSRSRAAPTRSRCATGRWSTPSDRTDERDQVTGVCEAVEELWTENRGRATSSCSSPVSARSVTPPTRSSSMRLPQTEVLPLYARLSAAEQHRVFGRAQRTPDRAGHQRRRDVADRARHPLRRRRRHRPHLPLQPAHQGAAPADRAGLAGQRQPARRPLRARRRRHLHPALLRGGLRRPAGVHRARDPAHQPRVGHPADDLARARRHRGASRSSTPPTRARSPTACACWRSCRRSTTGPGGEAPPAAGRRRGAGRQLTAYGRSLARLPRRPAARHGCSSRPARCGCTREVLVIVAALSMQDPRERPADKQTQADQSHARFRDEHSDFVSLLNLWAYLKEQQKALCAQRFPAHVPSEFLHYLRVREWQDLHSQLRKACQDVGHRPRARPPRPRTSRPNADLDPPGAAGRAALAHRPARRGQARLPRGPRRPVRHLAGLDPVPPPADLGDVGRAGRDHPACGRAPTPGSTPSGPSGSPRTWSSAPTASRAGPASRGPPWRPSG